MVVLQGRNHVFFDHEPDVERFFEEIDLFLGDYHSLPPPVRTSSRCVERCPLGLGCAKTLNGQLQRKIASRTIPPTHI